MLVHLKILLSFVLPALLLGCSTSTQTSPPNTDAQSVQISTPEIPNPTTNLESGRPDIGREYFMDSNRGRCLECHTLNGEGAPGTWALDDTGLRRDPEWLAVFIDNPRNLRPEVATQPPYRGDSKGATIADIVAFLMTLKTPVDHPPPADIKPPDEPDKWEEGIGGYTGHHP